MAGLCRLNCDAASKLNAEWFYFCSLAFETLGLWGPSAISLVPDVGTSDR